MAAMTPKRLRLHACVALMALAQSGWAQRPPDWTVHWRVVRIDDGAPEAACVAVELAPQGRVLARHLNTGAVSELDGYGAKILPSPGPGTARVYSSPAGQLWTVADGGLLEFKDSQWLLHPVAGVANARSIPLWPVRQSLVLALLPDRLLEFNAEDPEHSLTEMVLTSAQTQLGEFSGMTVARDGGLWLAGEHGLIKFPGPVRSLKAGTDWQESIAPEALQIQKLQDPNVDANGVVTVLAKSSTTRRKMLVRYDGQHWAADAIPVENTLRAWRSVDDICCAATTDSLHEWEAGVPASVRVSEHSGRRYFDVAVEPGGAFWLATSDGLFRQAPLAWRTPAAVRGLPAPVHCITADGTDGLWFVADGSLQLLQSKRRREFPLPAIANHNPPPVHSLFPLKNGTLWIETTGQPTQRESLQFEPSAGQFSPLPPQAGIAQFRPLGMLRDGRLCVQALSIAARPQAANLQAYDGTRFEPLSLPLPEPSVGADLINLFAAQNGDLWVSGDRGTACYHDQKWRSYMAADRSRPESVLGFTELADGKIWCATRDKVWAFDGRDWSAMKTGLDHVNGFIGTRDGSLWVATDSGLQRLFQGAWVENGTAEGLPSEAVTVLGEDQLGQLWAGTARGLSLYHAEADPDPPRTFVQDPMGKRRNIPEGGSITLAFTALDKWNYTPRSRLLYSWRLDGREWSPFGEERNVSFSELPAGKHYFQVRAMDRNCNVDPEPARLEFAFVVPWYKESRLVVIAFAGLAVALFFAGLAINRHRQLLRSYAAVEQKVAQRTQELELANRQLLHSQKMNALGTLAAGIAHDFNNILSIIKGSAQIIEDNVDSPQKIHTRVDRIKTVVEQGAGIVKAMLGFSRESDDQSGPCDLNAVLEDTVKLLGDRFLREVQITLDCASEIPAVPCSKNLVQQVLLNFIFNAAESMSQRKQIVLATRLRESLPPDLALAPAPAAAAYVAVSVRDTGCGIPAETLPRIFEPFFTTKAMSARRGTGLGLSMVYELAKKMEAGLAVESVVDQGSTFTLILPVRPIIKEEPK